MCPRTPTVESDSGTIEHTETEPSNTLTAQPWYSLVPFVQYFISVTPTGRPLLPVIWYSFEVACSYATIHLSIEMGRRVTSLNHDNVVNSEKCIVVIVLTCNN